MTYLYALMAVVALLAACFGFVAYIVRDARRGGEATEKASHAGEVIEAAEQHKQIEVDVGGLPPDDARKRLQRWTRG